MRDAAPNTIAPVTDGYTPQVVRRMALVMVAAFVLFLAVMSPCENAPFGGIVSIAIALMALVKPRIGRWAVTTCAFGILVALVLVATPISAPRARNRTFCVNNLRQLGLALQAYHEANGSFPPAYIADENGRPMHSWRTLLLAYLERPEILAAYRFDEPWDGPNNKKLHLSLSIFRCPAADEEPSSTTNYMAVVGPGTAWPGSTSASLDSFTDGAAQTILLVEVADSDVIWCEPRDLHISQMSLAINGDSGQGMSSHHPQSVHVVTADCSVHSISEDLDSETLRALLTPRGDEPLEENDWAQ